jgi:uncharacterized protein YceK
MKKINTIFVIISIIFILSGCSSKNLLTDKMEASNIDKIQIVMGGSWNPKYGEKAKIITDKNEISELVYVFNNATISKIAEDTPCGTSSQYCFYSKDTLVQSFCFASEDSEIMFGTSNTDYNDCYINYLDKTPYELYKSSAAEIITVYDR